MINFYFSKLIFDLFMDSLNKSSTFANWKFFDGSAKPRRQSGKSRPTLSVKIVTSHEPSRRFVVDTSDIVSRDDTPVVNTYDFRRSVGF